MTEHFLDGPSAEITRRNFLRAGLAGAAAAVLVSCASESLDSVSDQNSTLSVPNDQSEVELTDGLSRTELHGPGVPTTTIGRTEAVITVDEPELTTTTTTTSTTSTTTTTTTIPMAEVFQAPVGSMIGRVEVPSLILSSVFQGAEYFSESNLMKAEYDYDDLDKGAIAWAGAYEGPGFDEFKGRRLVNAGEPGDYQHTALFSHRMTPLKDPAALRRPGQEQGPFENLDLVQYGDELIYTGLDVESGEDMGRFVYKAILKAPLVLSPINEDFLEIVYPQIAAPTISLWACTPKGSVAQRIIQRFERVA